MPTAKVREEHQNTLTNFVTGIICPKPSINFANFIFIYLFIYKKIAKGNLWQKWVICVIRGLVVGGKREIVW